MRKLKNFVCNNFIKTYEKSWGVITLLPFEQRKPTVIVKRDAEQIEEGMHSPEERTAEELINYGIINVNKSDGPTSHMVADYVQKVLHIKKDGHGGTLDPGVTGVLPVATEKATRVVQALLKAGKEYVCLMHVHKKVDEKLMRETIQSFVGKIKQLPPLRSAVKRVIREREVYYIDILEIEGQDVLFKVGCQAGTYIRTLCVGIGRKLKCGAHMAELVRTKAGPFKIENSVSLQDLEDAYWYWKNENNDKFLRHCIKPMEFAVQHIPKVWVQNSAITSLCHGANLNIPGIVKFDDDIKKEDMVAVLTLTNELILLGNAKMTSEEIQKEEKGFAVKSFKVFMQ